MENSVIVDLDDPDIPVYEAFTNVYQWQHSLDTDLENKTYLGERKGTCRYCGQKAPIAKFSSDAHVIPQAIGNRYLLSWFECDACNKLFGDRYEPSFTNFLSHLRPFAKVENKNRTKDKDGNKKDKNVKHKEFKTGFEMSSTDLGLELKFRDPKYREDVIKVDREKLEMGLTVTLPQYTPLFVYKTFMKIALAMINESELGNFEKALHLLQHDRLDERVAGSGICRLFVTSIPGGLLWPKPYAVLHTKKDEHKNSLHPDKSLTVLFSNRMFQMFPILSKKDDFLTGKKTTLMRFPPAIDKAYYSEFGRPSSEVIDLSSNKVATNIKHTMRFEYVDGDFIDPI